MQELTNLDQYAKTYHSQSGEEGILEHILEILGTTNKVAVEFGAGDGYSLSNTRHFIDLGWTGIMFDLAASEGVCAERITAENVNDVFRKYEIPEEFDLLSIDIDGNDYWVWKALEFRPRVVIIEFNGTIPTGDSKTITYDPEFRHDGTDYYGASLLALKRLGRNKGYTLIHQRHGLNAFFVRSDLLADAGAKGWAPRVTYSPLQYHPPDPKGRPWEWLSGLDQ